MIDSILTSLGARATVRGTRITSADSWGTKAARLLTDYTVRPPHRAAAPCARAKQPMLLCSLLLVRLHQHVRSDSGTDFDCQSAYGGDNGYNLPAAYNTGTVSLFH